jgi:tryptophan-rich sensory protein
MSDIDRQIAAWDRPDRVGLLANIALFVGTTIVLNGIIFAFGIDRRADALTRLSWAPPGWTVGTLWVLLFSLYAVAHWLLLQGRESGRRAASWVRAIAVWSFVTTPEWQTLQLPFAQFTPHRIDISLNTKRLRRIGLVAIGREFNANLAVARLAFY